MIQNTDYEQVYGQNTGRVGDRQKRTAQAQPPAPRIISKKYWCSTYNLTRPRGGSRTDMLYKKVLTPAVLAAIGKTEAEVRLKSVKDFDAVTSLKLIEILNL